MPAVCYKRYTLINLIRCLPQKAWQICLIAIGSLCFTVNLCTHRLPQQVKERSTHWEKAKNNLCNTCWYLQWERNAMRMQWSWQTWTMIRTLLISWLCITIRLRLNHFVLLPLHQMVIRASLSDEMGLVFLMQLIKIHKKYVVNIAYEHIIYIIYIYYMIYKIIIYNIYNI